MTEHPPPPPLGVADQAHDSGCQGPPSYAGPMLRSGVVVQTHGPHTGVSR